MPIAAPLDDPDRGVDALAACVYSAEPEVRDDAVESAFVDRAGKGRHRGSLRARAGCFSPLGGLGVGGGR